MTQIVVPPMCQKHQHIMVVHELRIDEDGPWRVAIVVCNMLLMQLTTMDERFWKRVGDDKEAMSLVLAEIGCLACWDKKSFKIACCILKKGLDHAAKVTRNEANDPECGFVWPTTRADDIHND